MGRIMKRFFQIVGVIFAVFVLSVIAGAFMSETENVEAVSIIDADLEDVVDYLEDLENWPDWLSHIPNDTDIVFGETLGEGASLVWQQANDVGSVDLVQVTDDLIRATVMTDGASKTLTIALAQEAGVTTLLIQQERDLGGFPYLARLRSQLRKGGEAQRLQSSLDRLSVQLSN